MANRNLTAEELVKANVMLDEIRKRISELSGDDAQLRFAYRRKIFKELGYDERGKPTHRKVLKLKKVIEQDGMCLLCKEKLPEKYAVLDRLNAFDGYTKENTRVICAACDTRVQTERGYA